MINQLWGLPESKNLVSSRVLNSALQNHEFEKSVLTKPHLTSEVSLFACTTKQFGIGLALRNITRLGFEFRTDRYDRYLKIGNILFQIPPRNNPQKHEKNIDAAGVDLVVS